MPNLLMRQFFIEVGWDDGDPSPYSTIVWILCNRGVYQLRSFVKGLYNYWLDDFAPSALIQGY